MILLYPNRKKIKLTIPIFVLTVNKFFFKIILSFFFVFVYSYNILIKFLFSYIEKEVYAQRWEITIWIVY